MEALNLLLKELQNKHAAKESEIGNSGITPNSYILSALKNCENEIEEIAAAIKFVPKDPTLHQRIVVNFTADAQRIAAAIENINISNY